MRRGRRAKRGGAGRGTERGARLAGPHLHPLYVQHEATWRGKTKVQIRRSRHPRRHHGRSVSKYINTYFIRFKGYATPNYHKRANPPANAIIRYRFNLGKLCKQKHQGKLYLD